MRMNKRVLHDKKTDIEHIVGMTMFRHECLRCGYQFTKPSPLFQCPYCGSHAMIVTKRKED